MKQDCVCRICRKVVNPKHPHVHPGVIVSVVYVQLRADGRKMVDSLVEYQTK